MSGAWFEGFREWYQDAGGGVVIHGRSGGTGPAVLLLHGHPRTHTTWWQVAPRLVAAGYSVVCADLRGYGRSSKPPTAPDHRPYAKRAMAGDMVAVMHALGFEHWAVVGHDRGSYVATRMALDHPEPVTALAVLDCIPISEHLERAGADFAQRWWHWFFFAQAEKPEQAILADPDAWYGGSPEAMGEANYADFYHAIHDPATVRAMLEDYRAGLGPDRADEKADRDAGRQITCPTLVGWSAYDDMGDLYGDVTAVWDPWATDLRGRVIDSGHHMAEEAPEQLAGELTAFLGGIRPGATPAVGTPSG
jgi:haloacetate dehalogenase